MLSGLIKILLGGWKPISFSKAGYPWRLVTYKRVKMQRRIFFSKNAPTAPSPFLDHVSSVLLTLVSPGPGAEQFNHFLLDELRFSSHMRGVSMCLAGVSQPWAVLLKSAVSLCPGQPPIIPKPSHRNTSVLISLETEPWRATSTRWICLQRLLPRTFW